MSHKLKQIKHSQPVVKYICAGSKSNGKCIIRDLPNPDHKWIFGFQIATIDEVCSNVIQKFGSFCLFLLRFENVKFAEIVVIPQLLTPP